MTLLRVFIWKPNMDKRDVCKITEFKMRFAVLDCWLSSCHGSQLFFRISSALQCRFYISQNTLYSFKFANEKTGARFGKQKSRTHPYTPEVAVSRCSFTATSHQVNGNYPLGAQIKPHYWGLEEILECCSSFLESMKTISLGGNLSVCFPHISQRTFLAFRSDYFNLSFPQLCKYLCRP